MVKGFQTGLSGTFGLVGSTLFCAAAGTGGGVGDLAIAVTPPVVDRSIRGQGQTVSIAPRNVYQAGTGGGARDLVIVVQPPTGDRAIRSQRQTVETTPRNGCVAGTGGGVGDLAVGVTPPTDDRAIRKEVSASLQEDLASHLRISEEMACDDLVLESTHPEVHQYANSLLNGAELLSLSAIRPSVVASGINSGGNLGKRLKMMITEIPWKVSASLRLGIVAMAFCILPLGLVYAQDFKAVERRLGGAVETGELTLKQASIMMDALKRSAGSEHAHVRKMGAKKRRYMAFAKEIKAAVDAGKISKEEAKKKLFELRKKMFRNAGQNKKDWSDKGEDRAMAAKKHRYMEFAKEIKAAVDAGKISKEDAEEKLIGLRKEMFSDGD